MHDEQVVRAREFIEALQREEPSPEHGDHLAGAVLPAWLQRARDAQSNTASNAAQRDEGTIQRGEVWRVRAAPGARTCWIVVCDVAAETVSGLFAHGELWLASAHDVIVEEARSPTGRALVLCTGWGARKLTRDKLLVRLGEVERWEVAIATLGSEGVEEEEVYDTRDDVRLMRRRCVERGGALYLSGSGAQHEAVQRALRIYAELSGMRRQQPGWFKTLHDRLLSALRAGQRWATDPIALEEPGQQGVLRAPAALHHAEHDDEILMELEVEEGSFRAKLSFEFDHEARGVRLGVYAERDGRPATGARVEVVCGERAVWPALELDEDGLGETSYAAQVPEGARCTLSIHDGALHLERHF